MIGVGRQRQAQLATLRQAWLRRGAGQCNGVKLRQLLTRLHEVLDGLAAVFTDAPALRVQLGQRKERMRTRPGRHQRWRIRRGFAVGKVARQDQQGQCLHHLVVKLPLLQTPQPGGCGRRAVQLEVVVAQLGQALGVAARGRAAAGMGHGSAVHLLDHRAVALQERAAHGVADHRLDDHRVADLRVDADP